MMDCISHSIECYMDLLATRQKLVASNIVNLDTPGYRTRDIDFQDALDAAVGRDGNGAAVSETGAPLVREVTGLEVKNDGNNVSLEREAQLLGENAMRFEMASTMLSSRVRMLRLAIKEGNLG